jgi:hypothetical protein
VLCLSEQSLACVGVARLSPHIGQAELNRLEITGGIYLKFGCQRGVVQHGVGCASITDASPYRCRCQKTAVLRAFPDSGEAPYSRDSAQKEPFVPPLSAIREQIAISRGETARGRRVPRNAGSLEMLARIETRYSLPTGYFKAKLPHPGRACAGHDLPALLTNGSRGSDFPAKIMAPTLCAEPRRRLSTRRLEISALSRFCLGTRRSKARSDTSVWTWRTL